MNERRTAMPILLRQLKAREGEMVRMLERFVRCETPSYEKSAVDAFGRIVATEWKRRGAKVQILHQSKRGDQIRAELWLGEGRPTGQVMVLGHLDTVYPAGTLARKIGRASCRE